MIDFTFIYFSYILMHFNVNGEISNLWYLVSVYIHIPVSWSNDDPSSGLKLVAT